MSDAGFSYQTSWTPHFRKAITMMATKSSALLQVGSASVANSDLRGELVRLSTSLCVGERSFDVKAVRRLKGFHLGRLNIEFQPKI